MTFIVSYLIQLLNVSNILLLKYSIFEFEYESHILNVNVQDSN